MVSRIKTQLYDLITGLGDRVAHNRNHQEDLPWLLIRTGGHSRTDMFDLRYDIITINVDIFSGYSGEKEVLEIAENIANHLPDLRAQNETIIYAEQKTCKVLDDNGSGPVRKHGFLSYRFLCSVGLEDKEAEE